jgi:DNA-directed RNA polymerase specialized sigma subunit
MYFNEKTTEAIENYQKLSSKEEKEKLYLAEIYPAFDKLVENLIFIHGFRGLHDSYDDLKNDCVTFLYEAIHKFDPTRGTKPFSYFNVVAKRWLIIRSKVRVSNVKKNVSIDDESIRRSDFDAIEKHYTMPSQDEQVETIEFIIRVHSLLDKIKHLAISENEIKCIDAIIQIFKAVNDFDGRAGEDLLLNKRAVFFMMREISGLNPKQLTTTIASLKKHYKDYRSDELIGIF